MAKDKDYITIYFFESEFKELKCKWFANKEDAITFARNLYSCTYEEVKDDDLPVYENKFYLNSEDVCNWLNKDLILF